MRETLELLEDLLIEDTSGSDVPAEDTSGSDVPAGEGLDIKYTNQIELAVCSVLEANGYQSVTHVGGQGEYDIAIGKQKWEVKQFNERNVLARLGSAKTAALMNHPILSQLRSTMEVIKKNEEFIVSNSVGGKECVRWFFFGEKGDASLGKKSTAARLVNLNILKPTMLSIQSGDLLRHLESLRSGLATIINLPDDVSTNVEILTKSQGDDKPAQTAGTVSSKDFAVKILPLVSKKDQTPADRESSLSAATIFSTVDSFLSATSGEKFDEEFWSKVIKDTSGVDGFIGVDFIRADQIPGTEVPTFSVRIRRPTVYKVSELTVNNIDTGRIYPRPMSGVTGTELQVPPDSVPYSQGGMKVIVNPSKTDLSTSLDLDLDRVLESISEIFAQRTGVGATDELRNFDSSIRKIQDTITLKNANEILSLVRKESGPLIIALSEIPGLLQQEISAARTDLDSKANAMESIVAGQRNLTKENKGEFVKSLRSLLDSVSKIITTNFGMSIQSAGRLRPGPLVSETLNLLEDLLSP